MVLLGELEDREHLEELVAHSGGIVSHNVTKNTSLVVLGSPYDSQRLATAVAYGADVLSPAELLAKLHAGDDLSAVDQAVTSSQPEIQPVAVVPPAAVAVPPVGAPAVAVMVRAAGMAP